MSMRDAGRIGFRIRGEYSALEVYEYLDVVYYADASYVALKDVSGVTPEDSSEFWQIFARGWSSSEAVTGVKGAKELSFRSGNVNLTPENIGALPATGKALTARTADRVASSLVFFGSVMGVYDGSTSMTVAIPEAVSVKGDAEEEYRTGPVNITKGDIGLGNVENKSPAEIRAGLTAQEVEDALGYSPSEVTVTVDDALSDTSENPVQNKVITGALAGKGDALSYDAEGGRLYLKSGDEVVSETEMVTGATQSWGTNTLTDKSSIAVGSGNRILTRNSIACGSTNAIAEGAYDGMATGNGNVINKQRSFAAGINNTVNSFGCAAFGDRNTVNKQLSFVCGGMNTIDAPYGVGAGLNVRIETYAGFGCGRYNNPREPTQSSSSEIGDAFVVGAGTADARSNALRVSYSGDTYTLKAVNSSGADYAEFIKPWADGNPNAEDRVGFFVTIKDSFLHKANAGDYITGITSGNPSVVGNADEDYYWRWERDVFGRIVLEDVPEYVQVLDDEGIPMFDEDGAPLMEATGGTVKRMKLSADYDQSLQETYIERKLRPEWDYVGMLGVLPVRDDGTCIPGQFCKCADGGIATLATERGFDTYMVIERVAESVVKVILR